jgi:menaquinone-9 beta-reductase
MKSITIVGGGLAGLTVGICLREQGIPTIVWEAGRYPRHRVCGEFISGRGHEVLVRLGLRERLLAAGAILAHTATFVFRKAQSPVRPLPAPALSISRFTLDALLAEHFEYLGGVLRAGERWRQPLFGEGIVCANGRRLQPQDGGWRWFGLKIHARNLPLSADLEMHALANGYLGLTRLKDGEVNVCGLFRRPAAACGAGVSAGISPGGGVFNAPGAPAGDRDLSSFWRTILLGRPGAALSGRLAKAVFDTGSFCSVAGVSLRPRRAGVGNECRIGDALTMTPPVTGNGMSMAFEAAGMAFGPLAAWSRAEVPWDAARQAIAQACDAAFGRRLAWARRLQWMMFAPALQGRLGLLPLHSEWFWRWMFARTR